MDHSRFSRTRLPEAISDVVSDFAELFGKELQLARAEISERVSTKLRGGIWLGVAGLLVIAAFGLALGGVVAWLSTFDLSLHAAFFIVAVGVGLLAVFAYFVGRTEAQAGLAPSRTIDQVKQDIEITKEQLS
jgi:hypothetical protein